MGLPGAAGAVTIVVETLADAIAADGLCSLREAIRAANLPSGGSENECTGAAGADTILLPGGTYTLSIPRAVPDVDDNVALTGDLDIRDDLTIQGSGAEVTIIDGGAIDRVLHVDPGEDEIFVEMFDLTIRNGLTPIGENAAGILNAAGGITGSLTLVRVVVTENTAANSGDAGVGVFNIGNLTLSLSEIRANSGAGGAGIFNENGATLLLNQAQVVDNTSPLQAGGIDNQGTMDIVWSLFAGNTATQFQGGGILNAGQATITESTLSGNTAGSAGGALYNDAGGTADLFQVTIADNGASLGGGGIHNEDTVNIGHSILAVNTGGNCAGPNAPVSTGYNLEDANSCGLNQTSDQINKNPDLGPLQDNGGFTLTHALAPSSPAVDAGDPASFTTMVDQRLVARSPAGEVGPNGVRDLGAFELDFPIVVNSTGDGLDAVPGDGLCEVVVGTGICTLRAAAQTSSSARQRIQLAAGTYVLSIPGGGEDESVTGDLDLGRATIEGAGVDATVIESQAQDRVFDALGLWLEIRDLTIRGGTAVGENGGCIRSATDFRGLFLRNVRVEGCSADTSGGGIYFKKDARGTVSDSTVSGNQAAAGGGIAGDRDSLVLIQRSLLQDNQATNLGGGLSTGLLAVVNSTLSGNTAQEAGAIFTNNVTFIGSSTIAGNTATDGNGGALVPGGSELFLGNSIVADNVGDPGAENCAGIGPSVFFSRGFNLESENSCQLSGTGDQASTAPQLVPLADNGGPTKTHALPLSSPAIDLGDPGACPATDQRGVARPADGDGIGGAVCDSGAFEGESCQPLVLENHTIDSAVVYAACESITLRNLTFGNSAAADLSAGNLLVLENGVVFDAGAMVVLSIDPSLGMTPP